jgi:hypothetical protein
MQGFLVVTTYTLSCARRLASYCSSCKNLKCYIISVLSSSNPTVKLQVYELLCAISLASNQGHALSLDALEHFKVRAHVSKLMYLRYI